jgi:hypothetical protein
LRSLPSDKLRDEIAKVQQDLKKMARGGNDSDDEGSGKKAKKAKRTGPSLLQLEREKYMQGRGAAAKGKRGDNSDLDGILAGFRTKIREAKAVEPQEEEEKKEKEVADERFGIEEDDSSGVSRFSSTLFQLYLS